MKGEMGVHQSARLYLAVRVEVTVEQAEIAETGPVQLGAIDFRAGNGGDGIWRGSCTRHPHRCFGYCVHLYVCLHDR